jgi:drug/metabolite transporter (DMT)-like permease
MSFLESHKYHLYLLLAGFSFSGLTIFTAILTRAGVDPFSQVFWRIVIGSTLCLILATLVFRRGIKASKKEILLLVVNAAVFVFGYTTFTGAIYAGAPLAKAIALNFSYPIPVIILSYFLLGEKPSIKSVFAILISTVSVLLVLEIWKIKDFTKIGLGEFLAWVNSFAYAGIIVWGTKIRKSTKLHPYVVLFYTLAFSLPILVTVVYLLNQVGINFYTLGFDITKIQATHWLLLLLLALSSSVIPIALIYTAAARINPHVSSILLLTEITWVYLFGFLIFGQTLTPWGALGSLGIMLSVLLV